MVEDINPEKMRDLLVFYKKSFVKHWDDEKYKWQAVKHFQDNWDINAEDFGKMFETATEKTSNLLVAANFFPRGMIINFSKENQEKTRQMFVSLFDEDKDLISRYENFKQAAKELQEEHNATHKDQWNANYQKDNAISTYLWLRYPDKYYIYKYSEYRNVAAVLDSNIKFTKGEKGNLTNGFALYNQLCEYLKSDDNIKTLLRDRVDESCYTDSELKTLTIDFGFHISRYYNTNLNSFVEEGAVEMSKSEELANLLEHTHNLILHGAPGTGKTHLARDIADAMKAEVDFVQFHPSYDYTDFVEGLRPVNDGTSGQIAFERKDGVFKKFCERALKNLIDSKKSAEEIEREKSVDEKIDSFLNAAIDDEKEFQTVTGNRFFVTDFNEKNIYISIPENEKVKELVLQRVELSSLLNAKDKIDNGTAVKDFFKRKWRTQQDSYVFVLYKEIFNRKDASSSAKTIERVELKPFIFIIDEINRGEMSKIFGELFFSIDPGYRGKDGLIKTQYQNLISDGDAFADGFYVPENVYIIGTMNDIDRNVESMDFAFRRRFTFKEIKATDTQQDILAGLDDSIREDAIRRMNSLNDAISNIEGLSSAYHIGGAYFLKLKELDNDFEKLWEYHLEGLLREYLRGMEDAESELKKLKEAYENPNDDLGEQD